jgi:hypothetical protein
MIRGSSAAVKRRKPRKVPVKAKRVRPKVNPKRIVRAKKTKAKAKTVMRRPRRKSTRALRPKKKTMPKRRPRISKKQIEKEAKFASLMNEILGGAKTKAITKEEIKEFQALALKERKLPLAQRVSNLIEHALESGRKPSRQTLNHYVKVAMSARTPTPRTKVKTVDQLVKRMVARKIPGMPKLKEKAVEASLHLAAGLENKTINFKKWAHEKMVV